jgi:hypothetical protein
MFDCANVQMRELLPELVAGSLDAAARARLEEHLAGCAECASELETLRLVRAAFASAPVIDANRIVAALPKPVAAARVSRRAAPVKRWLDWRIAAALTTITVGGLSLAVSERVHPSINGTQRDSTEIGALTTATRESTTVASSRRIAALRRDTQTPPSTNPRSAAAKAQLSFGGGTSDLDDASLQALLGALDEIDRAPIAPSAEPDRTPVLPVIKEGER